METELQARGLPPMVLLTGSDICVSSNQETTGFDSGDLSLGATLCLRPSRTDLQATQICNLFHVGLTSEPGDGALMAASSHQIRFRVATHQRASLLCGLLILVHRSDGST